MGPVERAIRLKRTAGQVARAETWFTVTSLHNLHMVVKSFFLLAPWISAEGVGYSPIYLSKSKFSEEAGDSSIGASIKEPRGLYQICAFGQAFLKVQAIMAIKDIGKTK